MFLTKDFIRKICVPNTERFIMLDQHFLKLELYNIKCLFFLKYYIFLAQIKSLVSATTVI